MYVTSSDDTPSTAAKATTASEQRKRDKLGPDIVALIESQKPTAIQELIFDLSMTMITLTMKVYEHTESARRFDLSNVSISKKSWLPGNVKKIKISLQCTSELEDDAEYLKLAAECKQKVETFQDDLNYLYYCMAVREREYAKEKRLKEFVTKSHKLFRAYTKHFSGIIKLGEITRPLDTTAALFLTRYLKENFQSFFGADSYLDSEFDDAVKAIQNLVPGMNDPTTPENIVTQPNPYAKTDTAITAFWNSKGFTHEEEDLYERLYRSVHPYFETVTRAIQDHINDARNEVTANAKLASWIESEKKEAATSATEAALATMSTMSPTTMTELITKQSTEVSETIAKKTALKLLKKQM